MSESEPWMLTLYVGGQTPQSTKAIRILKELENLHLDTSRSTVTVCDVLDNPELVRKENILALPTLVRESPGPQTRIIGDLSDVTKIWAALSHD